MPSYLLPATLRLSSELVGHTEPRGVINALHRMASWRGINVLGAWRSAHVRGRASKIVPIAAVRSALSQACVPDHGRSVHAGIEREQMS